MAIKAQSARIRRTQDNTQHHATVPARKWSRGPRGVKIVQDAGDSHRGVGGDKAESRCKFHWRLEDDALGQK